MTSDEVRQVYLKRLEDGLKNQGIADHEFKITYFDQQVENLRDKYKERLSKHMRNLGLPSAWAEEILRGYEKD